MTQRAEEATISDVAAPAGVSVSRALNGKASVDRTPAGRVRAAADALGGRR
jgi:DNA-binding LacI/PurR family transcriptional regulator